MSRCFLFFGRFQPFHNGHMGVVCKTAEILRREDWLVIGVVCPIFSTSSSHEASPIAAAAEAHHQAERNPWSVAVRLAAVQAVANEVRKFFPLPSVVTTAVPRPELRLADIRMWFPVPRYWIIPKTDEAFDEQKAQFFGSEGENVVRIVDNTHISGWDIRNRVKCGEISGAFEMMPECVRDIYFSGRK